MRSFRPSSVGRAGGLCWWYLWCCGVLDLGFLCRRHALRLQHRCVLRGKNAPATGCGRGEGFKTSLLLNSCRLERSCA